MNKNLKLTIINKTKSLMITVISIYFLMVLLIYIFQRSLQYFPNGQAFLPSNFEEVKIKTQDDLELLVWKNIPKNYKKIIVYFHGNAGNLGDRLYRFESFVNNGYGVIALSYRGYFGSQGSPSEAGFLLDAKAVMRYLKTQNISNDQVILFGESIGTGVAIQVASNFYQPNKSNQIKNNNLNSNSINQEQTQDSNNQNISQLNDKNSINNLANSNQIIQNIQDDYHLLILESPFYNIEEIAKKTYRFLPVKLILKDRFDSNLHATKLTTKVLIFHGDRDQVIPISSGRKLFELISSPKKFIELKGSNHVDTNPEFIVKQIEEFNLN